jgi:hypothetical protein
MRFAAVMVVCAPIFGQRALSWPTELVWQRIGGLESIVRFNQHMLIGQCIGDVDGDGHGDVAQQLLHRHFLPPQSFGYKDSVWILSGADGRTLREMDKFGRFSISVVHGLAAVGDMDGDGTPDYAVASHDTGGRRPQLLQVRSGRDDTLILQLASQADIGWGGGILGDVDLDGDGERDLAVTDPAHSEGETVGLVEAYGHDGSLLYTIRGNMLGLRYLHGSQRCIGKIGDLDGDGGDDFGIGVLDRVQGNAGIAVHSGRTGALLYYARAPDYPAAALGHEVHGCGDVDADGKPDFIASTLGVGILGVVVQFSGATGQPLRSWRGSGVGLAAADVDRDGLDDVIATGAAGVHGYSSRDGEQLFFIGTDEPQPGSTFGATIDVQTAPTDAFPRIVITDWFYGNLWWALLQQSFDQGRTLLYRSVPSGVKIAGAGCAHGLPAAPKIGWRRRGEGVRVHLSSAPPGGSAFLLVGVSDTAFGAFRLPLDLAALGLPGCSLYASIDVVIPVTIGTSGVARGYGFADVPLRSVENNRPGAVPLHAQWKVFDPMNNGAGLSEVLTWPVQL